MDTTCFVSDFRGNLLWRYSKETVNRVYRPSFPSQCPIGRSGRGGGLSFFIHPRIHARKSKVVYHRTPLILRLPFLEKEIKQRPVLQGCAEIVNFSIWLPITRADDCHARVVFWGKKKQSGFALLDECFWVRGDALEPTGTATYIPTGSIPQIVGLFAFDPIDHAFLHQGVDRSQESQIPPMDYRLVLTIDPKNHMSSEISLGDFNFPNTLLDETESYSEWKEKLGSDGYAVFVKRNRDNRLAARVMGNIPEKRLSELKEKELKGFEIRREP